MIVLYNTCSMTKTSRIFLCTVLSDSTGKDVSLSADGSVSYTAKLKLAVEVPKVVQISTAVTLQLSLHAERFSKFTRIQIRCCGNHGDHKWTLNFNEGSFMYGSVQLEIHTDSLYLSYLLVYDFRMTKPIIPVSFCCLYGIRHKGEQQKNGRYNQVEPIFSSVYLFQTSKMKNKNVKPI